MAQDLRTSGQLLLSPAGNRTVNETDVTHLSQEKLQPHNKFRQKIQAVPPFRRYDYRHSKPPGR
jgi:hypothetical protein